jgi:methionyl-tRNA formyltransferase
MENNKINWKEVQLEIDRLIRALNILDAALAALEISTTGKASTLYDSTFLRAADLRRQHANLVAWQKKNQLKMY